MREAARGVQRAALLLLVAALAACAPAVPREALRRTTAAYDATVAASAPLLSDLALAERRNFQTRPGPNRDLLREGELAVLLDFRPAEAGLRGSVAEPPLTTWIRRGLSTVGEYFDLLTLLAEGGNIDEAQAQVRLLADSVAALAAVPTGGASLAASPVVEALRPLIQRWAEAANTEELRRLVDEGARPVDDLLKELIATTPTMYDVLIWRPSRAMATGEVSGAAARRATIAEMNGQGQTVADYVALIEALRRQLALLAAAVRAPESAASLASLSAGAEQLLIDARTALRAVELLRAARRFP